MGDVVARVQSFLDRIDERSEDGESFLVFDYAVVRVGNASCSQRKLMPAGHRLQLSTSYYNLLSEPLHHLCAKMS